jgi:hypothetical protein
MNPEEASIKISGISKLQTSLQNYYQKYIFYAIIISKWRRRVKLLRRK